MEIKQTKYSGIYQGYLGNKRFLFTKSLDGKAFFNERMNKGYRQFDFTRSKLAAAVMKNISEIPIKENNSVLYLLKDSRKQKNIYTQDYCGCVYSRLKKYPE